MARSCSPIYRRNFCGSDRGIGTQISRPSRIVPLSWPHGRYELEKRSTDSAFILDSSFTDTTASSSIGGTNILQGHIGSRSSDGCLVCGNVAHFSSNGLASPAVSSSIGRRLPFGRNLRRTKSGDGIPMLDISLQSLPARTGSSSATDKTGLGGLSSASWQGTGERRREFRRGRRPQRKSCDNPTNITTGELNSIGITGTRFRVEGFLSEGMPTLRRNLSAPLTNLAAAAAARVTKNRLSTTKPANATNETEQRKNSGNLDVHSMAADADLASPSSRTENCTLQNPRLPEFETIFNDESSLGRKTDHLESTESSAVAMKRPSLKNLAFARAFIIQKAHAPVVEENKTTMAASSARADSGPNTVNNRHDFSPKSGIVRSIAIEENALEMPILGRSSSAPFDVFGEASMSTEKFPLSTMRRSSDPFSPFETDPVTARVEPAKPDFVKTEDNSALVREDSLLLFPSTSFTAFGDDTEDSEPKMWQSSEPFEKTDASGLAETQNDELNSHISNGCIVEASNRESNNYDSTTVVIEAVKTIPHDQKSSNTQSKHALGQTDRTRSPVREKHSKASLPLRCAKTRVRSAAITSENETAVLSETSNESCQIKSAIAVRRTERQQTVMKHFSQDDDGVGAFLQDSSAKDIGKIRPKAEIRNKVEGMRMFEQDKRQRQNENEVLEKPTQNRIEKESSGAVAYQQGSEYGSPCAATAVIPAVESSILSERKKAKNGANGSSKRDGRWSTAVQFGRLQVDGNEMSLSTNQDLEESVRESINDTKKKRATLGSQVQSNKTHLGTNNKTFSQEQDALRRGHSSSREKSSRADLNSTSSRPREKKMHTDSGKSSSLSDLKLSDHKNDGTSKRGSSSRLSRSDPGRSNRGISRSSRKSTPLSSSGRQTKKSSRSQSQSVQLETVEETSNEEDPSEVRSTEKRDLSKSLTHRTHKSSLGSFTSSSDALHEVCGDPALHGRRSISHVDFTNTEETKKVYLKARRKSTGNLQSDAIEKKRSKTRKSTRIGKKKGKREVAQDGHRRQSNTKKNVRQMSSSSSKLLKKEKAVNSRREKHASDHRTAYDGRHSSVDDVRHLRETSALKDKSPLKQKSSIEKLDGEGSPRSFEYETARPSLAERPHFPPHSCEENPRLSHDLLTRHEGYNQEIDPCFDAPDYHSDCRPRYHPGRIYEGDADAGGRPFFEERKGNPHDPYVNSRSRISDRAKRLEMKYRTRELGHNGDGARLNRSRGIDNDSEHSDIQSQKEPSKRSIRRRHSIGSGHSRDAIMQEVTLAMEQDFNYNNCYHCGRALDDCRCKVFHRNMDPLVDMSHHVRAHARVPPRAGAPSRDINSRFPSTILRGSLLDNYGIRNPDRFSQLRSHAMETTRDIHSPMIDDEMHSEFCYPYRHGVGPLYERPLGYDINAYVHMSNATRLSGSRRFNQHRGRTFQRFHNDATECNSVRNGFRGSVGRCDDDSLRYPSRMLDVKIEVDSGSNGGDNSGRSFF